MNNLQFAVFGNPIKHSYSPIMHQLFARQCGLENFSYVKTLVEEIAFEKTVYAFFEQGGKGLNITVPFKLKAFKLAEKHLTTRAQAAGAVNTLWYKDNIIHGDNTDGIGLVRDIVRLGINPQGKRILLIGAGGASRGAILPLITAGCSHLHIANRTAAKAQQVVSEFEQLRINKVNKGITTDIIPSIHQLSASSLNDIEGTWDIIINASASSLANEEIPVPPTIFAQTALVYDMLYTPTAQTSFLTQAKKYGAKYCADGLGMLVYQGAEAFTLWTHCHPQPELVLTALRQMLQQNI